MKKTFFTLALALGLSTYATAGVSVDPDLNLTCSSGSGVSGSSVDITITFDNTGVQDVQGWSFGICHDSAGVEVVAGSVADGATTAMANGGSAPGFNSISEIPGSGFSVGVVIDFFGVNFLTPGSGYELNTASYDLVGPSGNYALSFCDTLGTPPVVSVIVIGGASITPVLNNGAIDILSPNFLTVGTATGILGENVNVPVSITNVDPVSAVQTAIAYDSALLSTNSVSAAGAASGAEFFSVQPAVAGEIVVGLVMDFATPIGDTAAIAAGTDQQIMDIEFAVDAGAPTPSTAALTLTDGLGSPATNNLMIFENGNIETPNLVSGAVNLVNFNQFLRGDCNSDIHVDIADGIFSLNFLFQSGTAPVCDDACDPNDDGLIDSTDAIFIFNYTLLSGPAPAAPFPAVGLDGTTADGIGCDGDADDI